jgi:DNA-binding CsgD family transcriptional regulator
MLRDVLTQKGLSNREAEVAELVTKGLSNKEVANQLFVTEKTVKFHLTNIYKKMNVKSRSQLIVWCMPHMSFQENEADMPATTTVQPLATAPQATPSVIPAGNSTVSQQQGRIGTPIASGNLGGAINIAPEKLPGGNQGNGGGFRPGF